MSRWWLVLWALFTGYGLAALVYNGMSWFWTVVTIANASGVLFWFFTERKNK